LCQGSVPIVQQANLRWLEHLGHHHAAAQLESTLKAKLNALIVPLGHLQALAHHPPHHAAIYVKQESTRMMAFRAVAHNTPSGPHAVGHDAQTVVLEMVRAPVPQHVLSARMMQHRVLTLNASRTA
jgi:hypothetical protein